MPFLTVLSVGAGRQGNVTVSIRDYDSKITGIVNIVYSLTVCRDPIAIKIDR